jgi:hypothetical protein
MRRPKEPQPVLDIEDPFIRKPREHYNMSEPELIVIRVEKLIHTHSDGFTTEHYRCAYCSNSLDPYYCGECDETPGGCRNDYILNHECWGGD